MNKSVEIVADLSTVSSAADNVIENLNRLRHSHDLAKYEYAKSVRIAPQEIPYSHPVITLNTRTNSDVGLLCAYLHEQMHWYVTWYSYSKTPQWNAILDYLRNTYKGVPVEFPEGCGDEFSTYLHLIVNALEIEAVSNYIDRDAVEKHLLALGYYRWAYKTVLNDWSKLHSVYVSNGLFPIKLASQMSKDDLEMAGRMDEASI